jgi:serine/threonine protein kinase/Tol biopolymer transport system component
MDPQRWARIESLYHTALSKQPHERSEYLADACGEEQELRNEVETLLGYADAELKSPVIDGGRWPSGYRLGSYKIVEVIGAGGMGEVYRAQDTKLKRDVALKVLPEAFAKDLGRMLRFQREAEVLASLNHPNIAHIYGVEERALVMELVEGESPKGPMPFEDAWKIALQIADALEYAHERGVIHRDLKPANVKVTPEGVVKLLDFGLAKAFGGTSHSGDLDPENSPTVPLGATIAGTILGTAAYMSPEQAKGKRVDKRSDIWSWGVVLYELLTGERMFQGEGAADTLAAVIHKEPNLQKAPAKVRWLLAECLRKDPKERLRDIGDTRRLLTEETAPSQPRLGGVVFGWATAAVLAVITAGLGLIVWRSAPQPQRTLQLSVPLPENSSVIYLELSPDAKHLALVFEDNWQIYLRELNSEKLQPLVGADNAQAPFWSSDSRFIGFFAEGKLKVTPAAGGPARELCEAPGAGGGTWNRNGVILFSSGNGFRRVNANGGQCNGVGKEDAAIGFPTFMPDGNHFFYVRQPLTDDESAGVYLASLDEPIGRKVLSDLSNVVYTPPASAGGRAHLLFTREHTLMAQPFDDASFEPVGDPFMVAPHASPGLGSHLAASAAPDGTLVYLAGRSRVSELTWFDRNGKEIRKIGPQKEQGGVAPSPNGQMVAILREEQYRLREEWVYDLERGPRIRLTPPGSFAASGAVWSPRSDRVLFAMVGPAGPGIYQADVKGGSPELLAKSDAVFQRTPSDWSHDGRFLIYTQNGAIWYVALESGKPGTNGTRFSDGTNGQLSTDGKWLAYSARDRQVQIRPFPTGEGVWQIPFDNALEPRWSSDGKELYFISGAIILGRVTLMAAPIERDGRGGLRIGTPQRLFDVRLNGFSPQSNAFAYSPCLDGQCFLVNALVESGEPTVNVITNWQKAAGR